MDTENKSNVNSIITRLRDSLNTGDRNNLIDTLEVTFMGINNKEDQWNFLKYLQQKLDRSIAENEPKEYEIIQIRNIIEWVDSKKIEMIIPDRNHEDFREYGLFELIEKSKDEIEIMFHIKTVIKWVKNKNEFILWAKYHLERLIPEHKSLISGYISDFQKERDTEKVENLKFGLKIFNETKLIEDFLNIKNESKKDITLEHFFYPNKISIDKVREIHKCFKKEKGKKIAALVHLLVSKYELIEIIPNTDKALTKFISFFENATQQNVQRFYNNKDGFKYWDTDKDLLSVEKKLKEVLNNKK